MSGPAGGSACSIWWGRSTGPSGPTWSRSFGPPGPATSATRRPVSTGSGRSSVTNPRSTSKRVSGGPWGCRNDGAGGGRSPRAVPGGRRGPVEPDRDHRPGVRRAPAGPRVRQGGVFRPGVRHRSGQDRAAFPGKELHRPHLRRGRGLDDRGGFRGDRSIRSAGRARRGDHLRPDPSERLARPRPRLCGRFEPGHRPSTPAGSARGPGEHDLPGDDPRRGPADPGSGRPPGRARLLPGVQPRARGPGQPELLGPDDPQGRRRDSTRTASRSPRRCTARWWSGWCRSRPSKSPRPARSSRTPTGR